MWMGKQLAAAKRQRQEEYADAEMGVMTMSGGEGAVQEGTRTVTAPPLKSCVVRMRSAGTPAIKARRY